VYLKCQVLGPIQGQIATPSMFCTIWRAAGPDIQFAQPCSRQDFVGFHEKKRLEKAHKLKLKKESPFKVQYDPVQQFKGSTIGPFVEGSFYTQEHKVCMPEQITCLNDLLKRAARQASSSVVSGMTYPNTTSGTDLFHTLGAMFKYWTGSRVCSWLNNTTDTLPFQNNDFVLVALKAPNETINLSSGESLTLPYYNPLTTIEVPYYSPLPYVAVRPSSMSDPPVGDTTYYPTEFLYYNSRGGFITNTNTNSTIRAGEDFRYIYLIAPDDS